MRRHRRRLLLVIVLIGIDAAALFAAAMAATYLRFGNFTAPIAFENPDVHIDFWQFTLLVVPLWLLLLGMSRLYDLDRATLGLSEAGRVARALSIGVLAVVLTTYVTKLPGLSRAWLLLFWVLSVAFVLVGRLAVQTHLLLARRRGRLLSRTLVVGSNAEASDIIRVIHGNPTSGLVPVGCLTSSQAERLELDFCSGDVPVLGSAREISEVVATHQVDTVIIASSAFDHDVLARMIAELRDEDIDLHISSGLFEVLTSRVMVSEVAGVPLISVKGVSLAAGNLLVKRVFDVVVAGAIVLAGLPVWVVLAVLVKATSPGPIFYSQERVGRGGEHFGMLKFRSMFRDADERLADLMEHNEATGPLFKMREDPRVTPIGRWMRKFSVDEFPQLLNVLRGEMSLVGPRPPLPVEVERYSPKDWRRLEVTPGMTGLWQVSGRSSLTFDEMVRLDLFYIENWSVGLDVTLLFRTVPAVLFARGAY